MLSLSKECHTSGFGASISITNTGGTAINGWTLRFTFPNGQTITQGWNGSFSQQGSTVTITNLSYNATIPVRTTLAGPPALMAPGTVPTHLRRASRSMA
ncbi:cellulose binding domain-containing protein [Thermogemmatispora sp.]|jgi:hypothetical protein|uniref:cellulose binding domain-containing protein n=1 Tax=Thermogemmatispora sp. TaxID=1968838 RepID=UPI002579E994|nr:cellulose binding domain-containing protein [Thermogemmatispora sp.]